MTAPTSRKELLAADAPETLLRGWAKAYRDSPEHRFPSDPDAEFFPVDLEAAANEIERLRGVAQNAWQPIETAPKRDGKHLRMFGDGESWHQCEFIGHWYGGRWRECYSKHTASPTHWMPCEPPSSPLPSTDGNTP